MVGNSVNTHRVNAWFISTHVDVLLFSLVLLRISSLHSIILVAVDFQPRAKRVKGFEKLLLSVIDQ